MEEREFQFSEGKSHKFWRIRVDGRTHTVQFGRIGTTGQTQSKEFADEATALRACEKLIAEKRRKGYVEVAAADGATSDERPTTNDQRPTTNDQPASPDPQPSTLRPPPSGLNARTPECLNARVSDRRIDLEPEDWLWATWRPRTPLPRPEPRPFDLEAALARLERIAPRRVGYFTVWNWPALDLPSAVSREEVRFWLTAAQEVGWGHSIQELQRALAGRTYDREVTAEMVGQAFQKVPQDAAEALLVCLLPFFSLEELVERFLAVDRARRSAPYHRHPLPDWYLLHLPEVFRRHILPSLAESDVESLRARLRPELDPQQWPRGYMDPPVSAYYLAARLGMHEEIRALTRTWPDEFYVNEHWLNFGYRPQEILFGLGDPRLVETEMYRLKLLVWKPEYIRAWLAHTEYGALDFVRDSILAMSNRETAAALIETLALVKASEVAPHMLALMLSSKAPRSARQWLEEHPGHAVAGLAPVAAGRGEAAEAALEWLRGLKRRGYGESLAASLTYQPAAIADRVHALVLDVEESHALPFDAETTPDWLRDALATLKPSRAASAAWPDAADLPPILAGERRLNDAQVQAVLVALRQSAPEKRHPLLEALKTHADAASLDAFAWRLFELWLREGAPAKEKWAFLGVGLLGADTSALKLAPLLRSWPAEGYAQRAYFGLECLRAMGTDTALMQIHGLAQKASSRPLRAKAMECLTRIAADRGLSREELEDLIVPNCGLDEDGSRVFDFGPRRFYFALGPGLKPMIRDESGAVRPDLPPPNTRDDAEMAARALSEWKQLKKQVADVARVQAFRLEQAMVTGRRWTVAQFETLLLGHPLLAHLVPLLVWHADDVEGRPVAFFRVTEDRTYAGSTDETLALDGATQVGLVHPLHMTEAERAAWGEILCDYEIVPPFPQLDRSIHYLEPGELEASEITRFAHLKIPGTVLVGTLDRRGWTRGTPEDDAIFREHSRPFYGAGVTAIVEYEEGGPAGLIAEWEDQQITRCFFVAGIYRPTSYHQHPEPLPLGQIDPVLISEVLADLTLIASKGK